MKLRHVPKTLSDCIAFIIDLANENEELKRRLDIRDEADAEKRKAIREFDVKFKEACKNLKPTI